MIEPWCYIQHKLLYNNQEWLHFHFVFILNEKHPEWTALSCSYGWRKSNLVLQVSANWRSVPVWSRQILPGYCNAICCKPAKYFLVGTDNKGLAGCSSAKLLPPAQNVFGIFLVSPHRKFENRLGFWGEACLAGQREQNAGPHRSSQVLWQNATCITSWLAFYWTQLCCSVEGEELFFFTPSIWWTDHCDPREHKAKSLRSGVWREQTKLSNALEPVVENKTSCRCIPFGVWSMVKWVRQLCEVFTLYCCEPRNQTVTVSACEIPLLQTCVFKKHLYEGWLMLRYSAQGRRTENKSRRGANTLEQLLPRSLQQSLLNEILATGEFGWHQREWIGLQYYALRVVLNVPCVQQMWDLCDNHLQSQPTHLPATTCNQESSPNESVFVSSNNRETNRQTETDMAWRRQSFRIAGQSSLFTESQQ